MPRWHIFPTAKPESPRAWWDLIQHALTAKSPIPSNRWLNTGAQRIDALGRNEFLTCVTAWLPLVGRPGQNPAVALHGIDPTLIHEHNADVLKGIAWMACTLEDAHLSTLLGDLAEVCFKKIPGHGARCPKLANAAVAALSLMKRPAAIAQLTRLKDRIKKPSSRKMIEQAINRCAKTHRVSVEELEEMAVPDMKFDLSGRRSISFGKTTALVQIVAPSQVDIQWRNATGKVQASDPIVIRQRYAAKLKELKRLAKDVRAILHSRAAYLERLLVQNRTWTLHRWRQRYLEHAIVGQISRRLIWQVDDSEHVTFVAHLGNLVNYNGQPITIRRQSRVKLWHPIDGSPEMVRSWRAFC